MHVPYLSSHQKWLKKLLCHDPGAAVQDPTRGIIWKNNKKLAYAEVGERITTGSMGR